MKKNKHLDRVYQNYDLTTEKLNRGYYTDRRYKQLTHLMHNAIFSGVGYQQMAQLTKYLEAFSTRDFNMLCDIAEFGLLDDLAAIIHSVVKTEVGDL